MARGDQQAEQEVSVENSHNSNPKKMVEVKDKWVKVRVTKGEEGQSSATVERGEQSQFESEEDCGPRDAKNDVSTC